MKASCRRNPHRANTKIFARDETATTRCRPKVSKNFLENLVGKESSPAQRSRRRHLSASSSPLAFRPSLALTNAVAAAASIALSNARSSSVGSSSPAEPLFVHRDSFVGSSATAEATNASAAHFAAASSSGERDGADSDSVDSDVTRRAPVIISSSSASSANRSLPL